MTINFTDVDNVDKRREKKQFALDIGEVISVPSEAQHTITVRRLGDEGGAMGAPALVAAKGDVSLPEPGDLVVIGFAIGGQRLILGTLYEDDAPSYKRGVRRIGHDATDANITVERDGSVIVTSDGGEVVIDADDAESVEVNVGGTTFKVDSSGVHVDGDLYINGEEYGEHTHEYTWTDDGGSGTTDPPS